MPQKPKIQKFTPQELTAAIKATYPDLAPLEDTNLLTAVLKTYPALESQIDWQLGAVDAQGRLKGPSLEELQSLGMSAKDALATKGLIAGYAPEGVKSPTRDLKKELQQVPSPEGSRGGPLRTAMGALALGYPGTGPFADMARRAATPADMESGYAFASQLANTATLGQVPYLREAARDTAVPGTEFAQTSGMVAGALGATLPVSRGVSMAARVLAPAVTLGRAAQAAGTAGAMSAAMESGRLMSNLESGAPAPETIPGQLASIMGQGALSAVTAPISEFIPAGGVANRIKAALAEGVAQGVAGGVGAAGAQIADTGGIYDPEQVKHAAGFSGGLGLGLGGVWGGGAEPTGRVDVLPAEPRSPIVPGVSTTGPARPVRNAMGISDVEIPPTVEAAMAAKDPFAVPTGDPFVPFASPILRETRMVPRGDIPYAPDFQHLGGVEGGTIPPAPLPETGLMAGGTPDFQRVGSGPVEFQGTRPIEQVTPPVRAFLRSYQQTSAIQLPLVQALDQAIAGQSSSLRSIIKGGVPGELFNVLGLEAADLAALTKGQATANVRQLRSSLANGEFEVRGRFSDQDMNVWEAEPGQTMPQAFWSAISQGAKALDFPTSGVRQRVNISPRWRWALAEASGRPIESVLPGAIPQTFPGVAESVTTLRTLQSGSVEGELAPSVRMVGNLPARPTPLDLAQARGLWEGLNTYVAPTGADGAEIAFVHQPAWRQQLRKLEQLPVSALSPDLAVERDYLRGIGDHTPSVPLTLEVRGSVPKVWVVRDVDMDTAASVPVVPSAEYQAKTETALVTARRAMQLNDNETTRGMLREALADHYGIGQRVTAFGVTEHALTRLAFAAKAKGVEHIVVPEKWRKVAEQLAKAWGVVTKTLKEGIVLPLPEAVKEAASGRGVVNATKLPPLSLLVPALVGPLALFGQEQGWLSDEDAAGITSAAIFGVPMHFSKQQMGKAAKSPTVHGTAIGAAVSAAGATLIGVDPYWAAMGGAVLGASTVSGLERAFSTPHTPLGAAIDRIDHRFAPVTGTLKRSQSPRTSGILGGNPLTNPSLAGRLLKKGDVRPNPALYWPERLRDVGAYPYPKIRAMGKEGIPAINAMKRYHRRDAETNHAVSSLIRYVYEELENLDEVTLFERAVMIGDRIERAQVRIAAGEPNPPIEQLAGSGGAPLTLADLRAYQRELAPLVRGNMNVKNALGRYQDLMNRLGDEAVKRGWMTQETRDNHAHYFHNVRLVAAGGDPNITVRQANARGTGTNNPVRKSPQFYLDHAEGSTLPSHHNVNEVIAFYVNGFIRDAMKDDLARGMEALYGPNSALGQSYTARTGKSMVKIPWSRLPNNRTFIEVPEEIGLELVRIYAPLPDHLETLSRATTAMKGAILKSAALPFIMRNFGSDLYTSIAGTPLQDWGMLAKAEKDIFSRDSSPTHPTNQILDMIRQEGVGAGGAVGDAAEYITLDPRLRTLQINPRDTRITRFKQGMMEPFSWFNYGYEQTRSLQESISREALALKEVRRLAGSDQAFLNGTPEQRQKWIQAAAQKADDTSAAYTDLNMAQQKLFKGLLFPFASWFIKTAQSYLPFIVQDLNSGTRTGWTVQETNPGTGKTTPRPHRNQIAAQKIALSTLVGVLLTVWNEEMTPEMEAVHPKWWREQPHINIPHPSGDPRKGLSLGMPGPLNTIAGFVGLQGGVRRVADVLLGKSDASLEWQRTQEQVRDNWVSTLNPMITWGSIGLGGFDLRTGAPVISDNAPYWAKAEARFYAMMKSMPFVSQFARGVRDTPTDPGDGISAPSSFPKFLWNMTFGSIINVVGENKAKANELYAIQRELLEGHIRARDERMTEIYKQTHQEGAPFGMLQGKEGVELFATKKLLEEMGPQNALLLYAAARGNKRKGAGVLSSIPKIALELSKEGGGRVGEEGQVTWEQVARLTSIGQNMDRLPYWAQGEVIKGLERKGLIGGRR